MIKVLQAKHRDEVKNSSVLEMCSFSSGPYSKSKLESWESLIVLNEVWIKPNDGLPMEAHSNTEIVTIILEGELTHLDTEGHKRKLVANEVQVLSSGKGVLHSEFNTSTEDVHLYRLWFKAKEVETNPSYKSIVCDSNSIWQLVVSSSGNRSLEIKQDVSIHLTELSDEQLVSYECNNEKKYWLQVLEGKALLNGIEIEEGDGVGILKEKSIEVKSSGKSRLLLIETTNKE